MKRVRNPMARALRSPLFKPRKSPTKPERVAKADKWSRDTKHKVAKANEQSSDG